MSRTLIIIDLIFIKNIRILDDRLLKTMPNKFGLTKNLLQLKKEKIRSSWQGTTLKVKIVSQNISKS